MDCITSSSSPAKKQRKSQGNDGGADEGAILYLSFGDTVGENQQFVGIPIAECTVAPICLRLHAPVDAEASAVSPASAASVAEEGRNESVDLPVWASSPRRKRKRGDVDTSKADSPLVFQEAKLQGDKAGHCQSASDAVSGSNSERKRGDIEPPQGSDSASKTSTETTMCLFCKKLCGRNEFSQQQLHKKRLKDRKPTCIACNSDPEKFDEILRLRREMRMAKEAKERKSEVTTDCESEVIEECKSRSEAISHRPPPVPYLMHSYSPYLLPPHDHFPPPPPPPPPQFTRNSIP